jgi:hypothetical protein
MIPCGAGSRGVPLWVPLFLGWLLLLPLALLLLPLFLVGSLIGMLNPFRVLWVFWGILNGARGTSVEALMAAMPC